MQKGTTLSRVVVVGALVVAGALAYQVGVGVPTWIETGVPIVLLAMGALGVLGAALLKLAHVQRGRIWGESWIGSLLVGAGCLLWGLSYVVDRQPLAIATSLLGVAIFIAGLVANANARKMRQSH